MPLWLIVVETLFVMGIVFVALSPIPFIGIMLIVLACLLLIDSWDRLLEDEN